MALKIRCDECEKKISIDEGFAGGMCRCPYCKAIVAVPAGKGAAAGARPDAPSRQEAPAAVSEDQIPMANPVKIQGVVTIILLVLLLGMVAGGIVVAVYYVPSGPAPEPDDVPDTVINPFERSSVGPAVAGIEISAPVVYVIDTGGAMRNVLDYALFITLISAQSLDEQQQFAILLCDNEDGQWVKDGYMPGGEASANAAGLALGELTYAFATDRSRALQKALAQEPKPATVVLLTRDTIEAPDELAAKAKEQGVRIVTFALDSDQPTREALAKLAEQTGGQSKQFTIPELDEYRQRPGVKLPKILLPE